jgi:TetR/AcrR family transcriptional regulator, transcriptional repressor for nem operon
MRVSRVQAEKNRDTVIDVASRLFRERGFDGIGIKDLMEEAGLTQGGFYKQFASKEDLVAQASERALESVSHRWTEAAEANPKDPLRAMVALYLSMEHRAEMRDGCPIVSLGADAARQGSQVKASFEAGIKAHLDMLSGWIGESDDDESRDKAMVILSTMVGAMVLSRAVNDKRLSKRFLQAGAKSVTGLSAGAAQKGQLR